MSNKYDLMFGLGHGRLSMGKKPISLMALVGVSALAVVGCEKGKVYSCSALGTNKEICATSEEEARAMCGDSWLILSSVVETNRSCWRRPRREGTVYECQPFQSGTEIYLCAKSLQEALDRCRSASPFFSHGLCGCTSTGKSC
jgi:hypothetical protein